MEINLSCPNIPNKPPPAYSGARLAEYLSALKAVMVSLRKDGIGDHIPIGIKTPPYTYADQFDQLINALLDSAKGSSCPISFITATNTLGTSLVLAPSKAASDGVTKHLPAINSANGTGIGGLAGAPLHPLALGNVLTLRRDLSSHKELSHIRIIGVGGVSDAEGYKRMRSVGAAAVGVGTALGMKGVGVFKHIAEGLNLNL